MLSFQAHFVMYLVEREFISKLNSSKINPTGSLVMRTSAKNTIYSEALIFILELLSQVKSDFHENL